MSLVNRFKNFRRNKGERGVKEKHCSPRPEKRKLPGTSRPPSELIPPPGEDEVSFLRHSKALQAEFKKKTRNYHVVEELMQRSFAHRRKDIMEHTDDLETLFQKYPFLQECDQVCSICMLILY